MSENIKPNEVSEVLHQQLKGINSDLQFDEVGNVLQVSDGVARIYGCLLYTSMFILTLISYGWQHPATSFLFLLLPLSFPHSEMPLSLIHI